MRVTLANPIGTGKAQNRTAKIPPTIVRDNAQPMPSGSRNVAVLAASICALSLGEELWQAYLPAFLTTLGASGVAVGMFGSAKDLLDSVYQYPGGWLSDRLGRRRALLLFIGIATLGYAIYAVAASWLVVFSGLTAVMAWKAAAFPTTFSVIAEALPKDRRATAFAVQSVLVRLPRVMSAPVGGLIVASLGIVAGLRLCFAVTAVIGLAVLFLQYRFFRDLHPATGRTETSHSAGLPADLRRLLVADCLVRIGEGLAASFIVLYVTQVRGVAIETYGLLYALQQAVAIAGYLPGATVTRYAGRPALVACTFLFFAAFPLAVRLASGHAGLVLAFVIGGFKEFGEPARKSLIVDLSPEGRVGASVGAYYGIRNLLVVPAGVTGGLLWQIRPQLPLEAAAVVSSVGLVVFLVSRVRQVSRRD
jgi:predicted MFS family arabinose efflux permease